MEDIAKVLLGGALALIGSLLAHLFTGSRERDRRIFETQYELVKDATIFLENYISALNNMLSACEGLVRKSQTLDLPEVKEYMKDADNLVLSARADFRKAQSLTRLAFGDKLDELYKELSEIENSLRIPVCFEFALPDSDTLKGLVGQLFKTYYKIFDEFQVLLWGKKP